MRTMVTKTGTVSQEKSGIFFATAVAIFIVTLLHPGVATADSRWYSICGGQNSEPSTVETILALAEEIQSSTGEYTNSPTGLRGTPAASPVLYNFRLSIADCRFSENLLISDVAPEACSPIIRDTASRTINPTNIVGYEPSYWCVVVFFLNREGPADLPGPSSNSTGRKGITQNAYLYFDSPAEVFSASPLFIFSIYDY